jgi:hypothetical protein
MESDERGVVGFVGNHLVGGELARFFQNDIAFEGMTAIEVIDGAWPEPVGGLGGMCVAVAG